LNAFAAIVSLLGIFMAYLLFVARPQHADTLTNSPAGRLVHRLWYSGWGFDRLYDALIVKPFVRIAAINKDDFIDLIYLGMLWSGGRLSNILSISQNGKVRTYALGIAFGAVVALAIVVLF
jgi:NADH-quinone oxidoreductase subunit L